MTAGERDKAVTIEVFGAVPCPHWRYSEEGHRTKPANCGCPDPSYDAEFADDPRSSWRNPFQRWSSSLELAWHVLGHVLERDPDAYPLEFFREITQLKPPDAARRICEHAVEHGRLKR